ncbi:MAG: radical SAM protein [Planctomycetes bacterium]|nr:radical SAM protein [Planctomycetota bacterium]
MDAQLRTLEKTLSEIPFPKKLAVELCADCNFACAMCHHPQMRRPKGVLPFELWDKLAREVAAINPDTECWFSFCGEPFLQPALLLRAIAHGKALGLRSVNVNTNGMLLTPELADPLLDSGVDLVVFGLDGFSRETYEQVRIGGQRDVVYANVEHLLARRMARTDGPEIHVQFIEMDENAHEMAEFQRYWLARGAVVKARNKLSWGGKFATPLKTPREERIACPWALTMMHVFWDGRVPRCPGDTEGEEGYGNAWHAPLAELWAKLGSYRALHLERRFEELPERCQSCSDWMTGAAQRLRPASGPFRAAYPTHAIAPACSSGGSQP